MRRILLIAAACLATLPASAQMPDDRVGEPAPDSFRVALETSTGPIEMIAHRAWSPAAVDRLFHLVRVGYYDGASIFRVVPGYVAQFGIAENPEAYRAWRTMPVPDEPVLVSNRRGRVAFARGGPETRTTQLFVNLTDTERNTRLDTLMAGGIRGYPPVAEIVSGMETVDAWNGFWGNGPSSRQDSIAIGGRAWLETRYPGLDWIRTARIIEEWR